MKCFFNFKRAVDKKATVLRRNFVIFSPNIEEEKLIWIRIMSIAAIKILNRNVAKFLRLTTHNFTRLSSTGDPCSSKEPESSKPKEPCPSRVEPCPTPPTPSSTCPNPPPCPPMPQCPPTICPPVLDSNNPCNYCPPPCPDPDYPDLTSLKKLQCLFQEENDIPVHLKKGNVDAFVAQTIYVLVIIGLLMSFYSLAKFAAK